MGYNGHIGTTLTRKIRGQRLKIVMATLTIPLLIYSYFYLLKSILKVKGALVMNQRPINRRQVED